jgi:hypothetical protein
MYRCWPLYSVKSNASLIQNLIPFFRTFKSLTFLVWSASKRHISFENYKDFAVSKGHVSSGRYKDLTVLQSVVFLVTITKISLCFEASCSLWPFQRSHCVAKCHIHCNHHKDLDYINYERHISSDHYKNLIILSAVAYMVNAAWWMLRTQWHNECQGCGQFVTGDTKEM